MKLIWNHFHGSTLTFYACFIKFYGQTSIDLLPSKNQALCEFCTHVNQLKQLIL